MNDLAREVLMDAAMRGVRQIKGALYDGEGGFCAMGVLIDRMVKASGASWWWHPSGLDIQCEYGLTLREWNEIVDRNNIDGWDFIQIARKVGVQEERA